MALFLRSFAPDDFITRLLILCNSFARDGHSDGAQSRALLRPDRSDVATDGGNVDPEVGRARLQGVLLTTHTPDRSELFFGEPRWSAAAPALVGGRERPAINHVIGSCAQIHVIGITAHS